MRLEKNTFLNEKQTVVYLRQKIYNKSVLYCVRLQLATLKVWRYSSFIRRYAQDFIVVRDLNHVVPTFHIVA